ncbi:hypothetical protein [Kitasatospora sp. NE20-6]|uniref:hypothetical protein n=1 Tax=Kitasatospora sp. NE20-6 TaxID=2859066 RepID=UPI0038B31583
MVNPAVERLSALLVPPTDPAGRPSDWGQVAESWNTGFPGDYRDFLTVCGAGAIDDYMVVATVLGSGPDLRESTISGLTDVARSLHQEHTDRRQSVWPQAGGLVCWGATVDCGVLHWDTTDPDSDRWPVVVRDRGGDFTRFDFGMAEFVLRILGPSGQCPLESPRLHGAPNSRFLNRADEKRIEASGGDPWEYLEELFEANEADAADAEDGLLIIHHPDSSAEAIPGGTPPSRCD